MEKRLANSGKVGIRKVVITGPESTGKTTLAQQLAHHFNTIWITEYAREYVENLKHPYVYEDLINITRTQIKKLQEVTEPPNQFVFLDTDLIIMKVWFQEAFQNYPEWLHNSIRQRNIDLYLLCATDIPWMDDPVRENKSDNRERLFEIYKQELESFGFSYRIITGKNTNRLQNAIKIMDDFFS
ncbi:MAG: ATP-binding protein [Bacteroidales bacterium]|nr:ATP-binding protein [Bacteroidales bacterium]